VGTETPKRVSSGTVLAFFFPPLMATPPHPNGTPPVFHLVMIRSRKCRQAACGCQGMSRANRPIYDCRLNGVDY
jgi:hypothetical protein